MNRAEAHKLVDDLFNQIEQQPQQQQSGQPGHLSVNALTLWLQLVALAIGPWLNQQLRDAIAPFDSLPDNREGEHRRGLAMLGCIMTKLRSIIGEKLADLVAGDTLRLLTGKEGLLLRPVES